MSERPSWKAAGDAERAAWEAYEVLVNRLFDHPATCDDCKRSAGPAVAPGSLLSVCMATCAAAESLDKQEEAAFDTWLKAHAAWSRALRPEGQP